HRNRPLPQIPQLTALYSGPLRSVEGGLLQQLTKRVPESAPEGEMVLSLSAGGPTVAGLGGVNRAICS
ncbi:hypothetical protein, partial [Kitasatospora sp. MBT63]|uniref:hypothetical protein n=1 Tax=Kitasatospora sp. MBT63 TaxID=1444768 RepID=UPI0019D6BEB9